MRDFEPEDSDPRLARAGLIAGLLSLPLAPFVIGLLPAAIGLHASMSHLQFRRGFRTIAWTGLLASLTGAILAAASTLLWGALLLSILLSRSALRQARAWEGQPIGEFRFTTLQGETLTTDDLRGELFLIDVFSTASPHCRVTLAALRDVARSEPELRILSWAPTDSPSRALTFIEELGVTHAVAVGAQQIEEPLALVSAKPTLFLIDAEGVIRRVHLGIYDAEGLRAIIADALSESRR